LDVSVGNTLVYTSAILAELFQSFLVKLRESSMHLTHGNSSFANSCSHLDASSADIAYSEYSWKAALEHLRRTGKTP